MCKRHSYFGICKQEYKRFTMKLSDLKASLQSSPSHPLRFILPDDDVIAAHAHITEVGRIEKTCLSTARWYSSMAPPAAWGT